MWQEVILRQQETQYYLNLAQLKLDEAIAELSEVIKRINRVHKNYQEIIPALNQT